MGLWWCEWDWHHILMALEKVGLLDFEVSKTQARSSCVLPRPHFLSLPPSFSPQALHFIAIEKQLRQGYCISSHTQLKLR